MKEKKVVVGIYNQMSGAMLHLQTVIDKSMKTRLHDSLFVFMVISIGRAVIVKQKCVEQDLGRRA